MLGQKTDKMPQSVLSIEFCVTGFLAMIELQCDAPFNNNKSTEPVEV